LTIIVFVSLSDTSWSETNQDSKEDSWNWHWRKEKSSKGIY